MVMDLTELASLCSVPIYKGYRIYRKKWLISYEPKYCEFSNILDNLQRNLRGKFVYAPGTML